MEAVVVLLSLSLLGCTWQNWSKTESVTPEYLLKPASAREIVEIVKSASQAGKRVRMTGNGHAASDVAICDEVLLTPGNLNQPLYLDETRLKAPAPEKVR